MSGWGTAIAGATGTVLLILFVHVIFVADLVNSDLRREADAYVQSVDRIFRQINSAAVALKATKYEECSPEYLNYARQQLFIHDLVRDAIVVDNALTPLCSGTEGLIEEAAPLPDSILQTRTSGRDIWHHMPLPLFDNESTSWAIRDGNLVIVSGVMGATKVPEDHHWEVMTGPSGSAGLYRVRGELGVHESNAKWRDVPILGDFTFEACTTVEVACITVVARPDTVWRDHWQFIVSGPVLALFIAWLVYALIRKRQQARRTPAGRIAAAVESGKGFYCVYQPFVDIWTGQPCGCEVLARYRDEFGELSPADFVPLIDEMGKTWEFSEIIFLKALTELTPLAAGKPQFKVSINLFPRDIEDSRLPVIAASPALRYAAEKKIGLNCEILETDYNRSAPSLAVVEYLRNQGFSIAIDDFGTGSSNLQQLQRLDADFIKIDRSFVSGSSLETAPVRSSLIPHIVAIAKSVGADVVAEGVETFEQVQFMRNAGVRKAQGFYFARPMPIDELESFVEQSRSKGETGTADIISV